jgi:hypothetical protein
MRLSVEKQTDMKHGEYIKHRTSAQTASLFASFSFFFFQTKKKNIENPV